MKKNWIIVLLIFIVPLALYWGMTRNELTAPPSVAAEGDIIIKFASPMCAECQDLDKVFEEVFPEYKENITLKKIDVTNKDKNCEALIKEYEVKLVPTTVFKNQDGRVTRRIEGSVPKEVLENYMKELING